MKGSTAPITMPMPPHSASTKPFSRIAICSSRGGTTPDQENCPLPVSGAAVGCPDDCLCVPPSERPGNAVLLPGNPAFLCECSIGVLPAVALSWTLHLRKAGADRFAWPECFFPGQAGLS